ncbi:MAG: type II CAAX endopeptidase family protein [Allomuricauda sp.]
MKIGRAIVLIAILWTLLNVGRLVFSNLGLGINQQNFIYTILFVLFLVVIYKSSLVAEKGIDLSLSWRPNLAGSYLGGIFSLSLFSAVSVILLKFYTDQIGLNNARSVKNLYDIFNLVILWPVLEELFFRNYLVQNLFKRYGLAKTILIGAILFSLSHIGTGNGIFMQFFSGLFFCLIYLLENKKILVTIFLHILMNSSIIFLLTNSFFQSLILSISLPVIFTSLTGLALIYAYCIHLLLKATKTKSA